MRFNHVTLNVGELERAKTFYRTLGLLQIVDAPPRYSRFVFPEGDATLSVEVAGDGDDRRDRARFPRSGPVGPHLETRPEEP